jgi:ABC-2 type transport system permease protein
VIEKAIRDVAWKSLAAAALLEVHLVIAIRYFPDFEQNLDAIRKIVPFEPFRKVIDATAKRGFDGYLALQHFFKATNTFGTFAAVFFGMGAVAGEVERRTIELLLSRPISRTRILATKYVAGALGLLLPLFLVTATAIPLARTIDEPVAAGPLFLQAVHSGLFLLALYSLTFALSTAMSDSARVAYLVLGVSVIEFSLLVLREASAVSYYKLVDISVLLQIVATDRLPWATDLGMAAASAALFAVAVVRFRTRDF